MNLHTFPSPSKLSAGHNLYSPNPDIITKRMKQFPQFCSPKWSSEKMLSELQLASKQFLIKLQKIMPSSQFHQIQQIWVLTNMKGENFISRKLITVPFFCCQSLSPPKQRKLQGEKECPRNPNQLVCYTLA